MIGIELTTTHLMSMGTHIHCCRNCICKYLYKTFNNIWYLYKTFNNVYIKILGGRMIFNFSIVQVHLFLLIEFHCTVSISSKILQCHLYYYCSLIRYRLGVVTSFYFHVYLSYFILIVPMRKCLGKHSSTSSPFL